MSVNRFTRVAAVLAIAVTATVVLSTTPASAAPAPAPVAPAAAAPAGAVELTNGDDSAGVDAAGNACRVGWAQITYKDFVGVTLWWMRMTTTYCYNGLIVTSHSTTTTHDVTDPGTLLGWSWGGKTPGFACYVASGSNRSCSGNHEWVTGMFDYNPLPSVCVEKINEWENYHGQFLWSTDGSTC